MPRQNPQFPDAHSKGHILTRAFAFRSESTVLSPSCYLLSLTHSVTTQIRHLTRPHRDSWDFSAYTVLPELSQIPLGTISLSPLRDSRALVFNLVPMFLGLIHIIAMYTSVSSAYDHTPCQSFLCLLPRSSKHKTQCSINVY